MSDLKINVDIVINEVWLTVLHRSTKRKETVNISNNNNIRTELAKNNFKIRSLINDPFKHEPICLFYFYPCK